MGVTDHRVVRPRVRFSVSLTAAVLALAAPATAGAELADPEPRASAGPTGPEPAPGAVRAVAGEHTVATDDGLYRISPSLGRPLLTHGPDLRAAIELGDDGLAEDGTGFVDGALERPPVCATDYHQRIVYAHVTGTSDRLAEATVEIRQVIGRMNAVLNAESIASGGAGADYRVRCDASNQVRVDGLTVPRANFADVVAAARAKGFAAEHASHLIFVDSSIGATCGLGSYQGDDRLSLENRNNAGGGYAVVYEPCWESRSPMHESAHMMGAVQYTAPNSTGTGGHCNEGADVLCYSPDGGDRNQGALISRCPGSFRFDCNFDDYFDSAPEPGEYLASHWNLGSPFNRFLSPVGAPVGSPEPQSIPEAGDGSGELMSGAAGRPGEWRRFKLALERGARLLRVRLVADRGADLALYARQRRLPSRALFDCRAPVRHRRATCRVEDPAAGTWHLAVLTRGLPVGAGFEIKTRIRH